MPQDQHRRQPGWRILVAATAVTLSGGAPAGAQAADAPSGARVTLDDVVPMTEVARPAALTIGGSTDAIVLTERYDQAPSLTVAQTTTDDGTVAVDASPTPNSPDPTPNTPDPTPNSPDPTPNTPDTPDPTPETPDPTPDTPDLTPESPITPDASPESPD